MKKMLIIQLFFFFFSLQSYGQYSWETILPNGTGTELTRSVIEKNNGNYLMLSDYRDNILYQIFREIGPQGEIIEAIIGDDVISGGIQFFTCISLSESTMMVGSKKDLSGNYHLFSVLLNQSNDTMSTTVNAEPMGRFLNLKARKINDTTISVVWTTVKNSTPFSYIGLLNTDGSIRVQNKMQITNPFYSNHSLAPRLDSSGYVSLSTHVIRFYDSNLNFIWSKDRPLHDHDFSPRGNLRIFSDSTYFDYFDFFRLSDTDNRFMGAMFRDKNMLYDTSLVTILPKPAPFDYGYVHTPDSQGADWKDKNHICVSGLLGDPSNLNEPKLLIISKLDSNLQIRWTKIIGDELNRYYFPTTVIATSDNGCIVGGGTKLTESSMNPSAYIIKLTTNGVLTTQNEVHKHQYDLTVYPNPSRGYFSINLKAENNNFSLLLTDIGGRIVIPKITIKSGVNSFDWNYLSGGIYFYSIFSGNKIINTGKWIKTD